MTRRRLAACRLRPYFICMRLILFHSRTCKTCRTQTEEYETNAPLLTPEIIECFVDEEAPAMMRKFHITDVPTTILLDDQDKLIYKWVDFVRTERVNDLIEAKRSKKE